MVILIDNNAKKTIDKRKNDFEGLSKHKTIIIKDSFG